MQNSHTTQSEAADLETLGSLTLTVLLVACVALVYWLCIVK